MEQHNRIKNIACFLTDYSTALLACGASSVRIEKNVARIAETYDVEAELSILTNHIILTVWDNKSDHSYSNVGKTKNSTISFYINTELSRLSWRIHDNYLELEKACKEYDRIINHPKINRWLVLLLVGFANASFCRLGHAYCVYSNLRWLLPQNQAFGMEMGCTYRDNCIGLLLYNNRMHVLRV